MKIVDIKNKCFQFIKSHKEVIIPLIIIIGIIIFVLCNKFQSVDDYYGDGDKLSSSGQVVKQTQNESNTTSQVTTNISDKLELAESTNISDEQTEINETTSDYNSATEKQENITQDVTLDNGNNNEDSTVAPQPGQTNQPQTTIQNQTTTVQETTTTNTDIKVKIVIDCKTIFDNYETLSDGVKALIPSVIPSDGLILETDYFEVDKDSTVFDVLKISTKAKRIALDFSGGSGGPFDSVYIKGIANLYEKDCGDLSGWEYNVNNDWSKVGKPCNQYKLSDGDVIYWLYTCDLGNDIH